LQGNADHPIGVLPLAERIRRPEIGSSETTEGAGSGEREAQATGGGVISGEADSEGCTGRKFLSSERHRAVVEHALKKYGFSEREACLMPGARQQSVGRGVFLDADSREDATKIQMIADVFRLADGFLDGTTSRGRSDSRQRHRPLGSAIECDGLEDFPYTHTIGNAIRLAPELRGRAGDTLQGQAASGFVFLGSGSKRHLHFF
jgi:hypothetical protein